MSTTATPDAPARNTLFDLTAEALEIKRRIDALAEETGGEVTEDTEAAFDELLDELAASEDALRGKASAYLHVAAELEAEEEVEVTRALRLEERAKAVRARAEAKKRARERILNRLQQAMEQLEIDKLKAGIFNPTLQGVGGLPAVDLLVPEEEVPLRFRRADVRLRYNLGDIGALALAALKAAIHGLGDAVQADEKILVDTAALRDALKGGDVDAEAVARFAPRRRRLVIK